MYQPLAPCTGCRRHVRMSESACPFCGALPSAAASEVAGPMGRMSRAALLAAGLAIAGCHSEPQAIPVAKDPAATKPAPTPSTTASAPPGLVDDPGSPVAEYGAPAPPPPPPAVKDGGLVDDHGGMHSKYGAPPPPPKPPPKHMPVPMYGMPAAPHTK